MKPIKTVWTFLRTWTNLSVWIVIAMVIGIIIGKSAPTFAVNIGPLGTVFIRMIQCIVGPLIFSTLVVGIAGHGDDLTRIGRLALKSIVYFEVVSTFALVLGLIAVNVARPGDGFSMAGLEPTDTNVTAITWVTELELIVPTSFFLALTDHTAVLAVVFCAIVFSVAITQVDEKSKRFMLDFNASLSGIMFKVVELVMLYAPIGIGCTIASTVGEYGLGSLAAAGKLVGTLYATLILFVVFVILPIVLLCRFPLKEYIWTVSQPFLMAFATSSSESALPKAMENMVQFGVPPEIAAFVIPTGYSFNLDGSTLYLALAAIFCAQVAGVEKSVGEQVAIVLTLMLTSKGVAAVPRASYIVLTSTLSNANIPLAGLALVMSVDAFMDMARSAINVMGNMTASAVIAKWEGEFRNEDWVARQSGQMPETLVMDDAEGDDDGGHGLPQHRGHLSPSVMHSMPLSMRDQKLQQRNMFSEKASVHSVESIHSSYSAYDPHPGSSSQHPYSNYGGPY
ncbi:Sodium:dicarboxylate symporter family-domain-containing protein [Dissophora ornata]|nr:Sodium:dicarboxylate symporter family-domain-containing protein [Dissophora ornata]